jgi:hypothetical protein
MGSYGPPALAMGAVLRHARVTMPFALRRGPAPVLGLDRARYRPGDAVCVTVTLPPGVDPRGHVRLRCHLPRDPALDALVDPPEIAGCPAECVELARAELAPAGGAEPDGSQRLTATVHIPPDAEPSCRGAREVAAWEVVAVVHRRAASAWVEVVPPGS